MEWLQPPGEGPCQDPQGDQDPERESVWGGGGCQCSLMCVGVLWHRLINNELSFNVPEVLCKSIKTYTIHGETIYKRKRERTTTRTNLSCLSASYATTSPRQVGIICPITETEKFHNKTTTKRLYVKARVVFQNVLFSTVLNIVCGYCVCYMCY